MSSDPDKEIKQLRSEIKRLTNRITDLENSERTYKRSPYYTLYMQLRKIKVKYDEIKAERELNERLPTVSVIIPTYKPNDYIADCIDSVLNQDYPKEKIQIIVCVNGDNVSYFESLKTKYSKNDRIQIVYTPAKGAASARNYAKKFIDTDCVTYLDDDDMFTRGYLKELAQHMTSGVSVVCGRMVNLETNGNLDQDNYINQILKQFSPGIRKNYLEVVGLFSRFPGSLYDSRLILDIFDDIDESLSHTEDVAFWVDNVYKLQGSIYTCNANGTEAYIRRVTENSTSRPSPDKEYAFYVTDRLALIDRFSKEIFNPERDMMYKRFVLTKIDVFTKQILNFITDSNEDIQKKARNEVFSCTSLFLNKSLFATKRGIAFCHNFSPYVDASAYISSKRLAQLDAYIGEPVAWTVVTGNMSQSRESDPMWEQFYGKYRYKEKINVSGYTYFNEESQYKWAVRAIKQLQEHDNKGTEIAKNDQSKNIDQDLSNAIDINDDQNNVTYLYSRSMWVGSHEAAYRYKKAHPNVEWYAEFSDPIYTGVDGELRRASKEYEGELAFLNTYWHDIEVNVCDTADYLIFTNINQRTNMLVNNPELNQENVLSKSIIWQHPIISSDYTKIASSKLELDENKINIGYFGTFYSNRGYSDMLAFLDDPRIDLYIFSNKPYLLQLIAEEHPNLHMMSMVPQLEFLNLAHRMDYCYLNDTDYPGEINPYLPSKLADYLSADVPIIALTYLNTPMDQIDDEHIIKVHEITPQFVKSLEKKIRKGPLLSFTAPEVSSLKELRVAAIMDSFTLDSYKPECDLFELTPEHWKEEIDFFQPQLVFLESAWRGNGDLWRDKISHLSNEYYQLTEYCHNNKIPVIFWNKEDPPHTTDFVSAARCADFIFTTDIDCIEIYKSILGHENVYFLPFAAQPEICNPVEKYNRKDMFCFAGSYYHQYIERARIFDAFSDVFIKLKGLNIYDRNYGNAEPKFAFPEQYDPYILGSLDHSEIDIAYKGYNYGINMNSIQQSQTMFARRVYEMMASNTVTIGNYSRGLKNMLGDLTICTDDIQTLCHDLAARCSDDVDMRKYRLLGLRKVLSEHLYEDRLDYIVQKVFDISLKRPLPLITCIAYPTQEDLPYILNIFRHQTYQNKQLILIGDYPGLLDEGILQISLDHARSTTIADALSEGYFGILRASNYYGNNYLTDLALTFRYLASDGIGKAAYYIYQNNIYQVLNPDKAYQFVSELQTDRGIFSTSKYNQFTLSSLIENPILSGKDFFSIDEFNFCQSYSENRCSVVDDMRIVDQGISLSNIDAIAHNITMDPVREMGITISWKDILPACQEYKEPPLIKAYEYNGHVRLISTIDNHDPQYIWLPNFYRLEDIQKDGQIGIQLIANGDLNLKGAIRFYDAQQQHIGDSAFLRPNSLCINEIPKDAKFIKLALRFEANGTCDIKEFVLGRDMELHKLSCFLSRSNVLVLTNHYPASDEPHCSIYIHQRVTSYRDEGYLCDVMRMHPAINNRFCEYEGIDITEGDAEQLRCILENSQIDTICVHSLDHAMWDILKEFRYKLRILIWIHDEDIHPLDSRKEQLAVPGQIEKGQQIPEQCEEFWKDIFAEASLYDMHFVFVSNILAQEVFDEYCLKLPKDRYSVIHNYIDDKIFTYQKKPIEQRTKILSIRPYKSKTYANDLTVKCIQELSQEDFFDELQFHIIGEGDDFWQINEPLKKYPNVILENRFLSHEEIADLYKEYGIFMVPSRSDTEGISRDEAMSSGLVPITNDVGTVSEFVDSSCGILAPAEDYFAMADGITRLYYDPELFEKMSENAAKHIREQSSKEQTIDREIALIWKDEEII